MSGDFDQEEFSEDELPLVNFNLSVTPQDWETIQNFEKFSPGSTSKILSDHLTERSHARDMESREMSAYQETVTRDGRKDERLWKSTLTGQVTSAIFIIGVMVLMGMRVLTLGEAVGFMTATVALLTAAAKFASYNKERG